MPKLSELAADLTKWNKEVFGNLFRRKRKLWARIEGVQRRLAEGTSRHILKLERRLRHELEQTLDQIALMWFQKAREDQIRDGDRNTKYFHTSTIIRRRFNRVNALKDNDGEWCTDSQRIQQLILAHFKNLFSEDTDVSARIRARAVAFPRLHSSIVQELQSPFVKEEVLLALKAMYPHKAPGPDGFHAYFFQQY